MRTKGRTHGLQVKNQGESEQVKGEEKEGQTVCVSKMMSKEWP